MSERINSYKDLKVYQLAFGLQQEIFDLSKSFPMDERFSLTDQIRRSSRSIGANIAEAWQKRRYPLHFVSKLSDADGENAETEHWLETAFACGYISQKQKDELLSKCVDVGKMLGSMIARPEKFCQGLN